jgi:uncharacterized protein YndB with AHSA1/START domain
MQRTRRTVEIWTPRQRVYDFITTPTVLPSIWPSMVEVSNVVRRSDGWTEYDWVYKMAGLHFKGHAKTEVAQPGKYLCVRTESGILSTFYWTFEGLDGAGTKVTCEVEYKVPAPVIGRLAETLVAKLNERELETLLANIKETMESTAAGMEATAHAPH